MKKALSIFLAILTALSVITIVFTSPTVANAETVLDYKATTEDVYGPFKYVISNGEVTITGTDSSVEGVLSVPAEIEGSPVKHIGIHGLSYCKNVTEIILPDGVETIGVDAFDYCEKLEKITLPDSITSISENPFYGTPFYEHEFGENPFWEKHTSDYGEDSMAFNEYYVLRIDNHIISVYGDLGEVYEIPEGVVSIADDAFREASKNYEVEIVIPSTLVSISNTAFSNFPRNTNEEYYGVFPLVTKYTVHKDNPDYSGDDDGVLYNKDKTVLFEYPKARTNTEYSVPDTVKEIADTAFTLCKNLETVNTQEPLETVGMRAFSYCTNLLNITLPDSVRRIKNNAFQETLLMNNFRLYTGPEYLYIGNHVIAHDCNFNDGIKDGVITFADYSMYENVYPLVFPDSVVSLGDDNFRRNTVFENPLRISENITYIGDGCFSEESVTYAFEVDEDNPEFSSDEYGVLYNKDKTKLIRYPSHSKYTEYTIPASVKVISSLAFANCQYLKKVNFESGTQMERIDYEAFRYCYSLEEINFPDTIKEIRGYAFKDCKNLKHVRLPDNINRIVGGGFDSDYLESIIIPNTEMWLPGGEFSLPSRVKIKNVYFSGSQEDWNNKIHHRYPVDTGDVDITVHYNCSDVTRTMKFYVDGKLYKSRVVPVGTQTGDAPASPSKYTYNFVGWDKEIPDVMPDKNLVFNAVWDACEYSFKFSYGEYFYKTYIKHGERIVLPEEIDPLAISSSSDPIPEIMPAKSVYITAYKRPSVKAETHDVTAYYEAQTFDYKTVSLSVDNITAEREPGGIYISESEYYEQIGIYNIKMLNENSQVVQPKEGYKVTVKMAIPSAYKDIKTFVIYHRFVDGGRERLSTSDGTLKVENGYFIFEVSSFSEFEFFVPKPKIKITQLPDKTHYTYNSDKIDLTGIKVKYTNPNGKTKIITDPSLLTVTGFNSKEIGKQTVTVSYGHYYDTFEVKVTYSWWQRILKIMFFGFDWF